MYCTRSVTDDLTWVGANDRRLAMFEGVYSVPNGVSYNAYLLHDEKTVLFDTVDRAVAPQFFENLAHALDGRALDYVIVQHMEPDHSATLSDLLQRYPGTRVVCNAKSAAMIRRFFGDGLLQNELVVAEGDALCSGRHTLRFFMAPMVHWPEVMVTYDEKDGVLFSADAFGTFGALNGALFSDEVDFMRDYLDEARRYYGNIVGKYGTQVNALLKKASALDIRMLCPLHGFVWRKNIGDYLEKYALWAAYLPEETRVLIAYASIYGHTENAAEILATALMESGVPVLMYDVSVTPSSEVLAAAFRCSHLVFAAPTYNAGVFITMDQLLRDIAAHNLQNRTVAFLENGTWAPTSGGLMQHILSDCKDMRMLSPLVSVPSAVNADTHAALLTLRDAILATLPQTAPAADPAAAAAIDPGAFHRLSYGLFVLTARENGRDNGCIVNTAQQLTAAPARITVAVNKQNLTHDMILRTGRFNVSVLTEGAPFDTFRRFGFQSGRTADKLEGVAALGRSADGLVYLTQDTNAYFSARVVSATDYGSHTLFVGEVTEAGVLSAAPSVTYAYYFAHIKPKPAPAAAPKKGFVCKICGYVYEGDTLPADFICPICKHGVEDFEPIAPPPEKKKGFVCKICGYVYEGDTLPADFICPICKHGAEDFEPLP